jgi:hypothetical protein
MTLCDLLAPCLALTALVASTACNPKVDDRQRQEGAAGLLDVEQQFWEYECACFQDSYWESTEECLDELQEYSGELDEYFACIDELLARNDDARRVLACQLDVAYDYLDCTVAQGCPEQFVCDDGHSIPESWVCDGDLDCAGGEDEEGDCRVEPFVCDDGETLPASWVCDGWPDCVNGEDEAGDCPETCESTFFPRMEACGDLSETFWDQVDEECDAYDEVEPFDPDCDEGTCASLPLEPSAFRSGHDPLPPKVRASLAPPVLVKLGM